MQPIEASEIDLSNFEPVLAQYGPKDIYAPAALVTADNIGQISLELAEDVRYFDTTCVHPYIRILAYRAGDDPIELTVRPGFWIVLVWGELHLFKDDLFQKTFTIAPPAGPEPETPDIDVNELVETMNREYKSSIDDEELEVRESAWTGRKILMRQGVFDQLSTEARSMFGPVEGMRKLSDIGSLELYDVSMVEPGRSLAGDTVEKVEGDVNEQTQFIRSEFPDKVGHQLGKWVPQVSIPIGTPRPVQTSEGFTTNAEKLKYARSQWEQHKNDPVSEVDEETKQRIQERIAEQPWMKQARGELAEQDARKTEEQQREEFLSQADPYKPGDQQ